MRVAQLAEQLTLSDMIGAAERRLAAFENRVPKTVWLIIFLVAVFQSFATGFSQKRRFWFSLVMTPLVVAVVMALVADLDSPHTGVIGIDQSSVARLVHDVTKRNSNADQKETRSQAVPRRAKCLRLLAKNRVSDNVAPVKHFLGVYQPVHSEERAISL